MCVVANLPSDDAKVYDNPRGEELLEYLRKVTDRKGHKITPVSPEDVPRIIRARLFYSKDIDIRKTVGDVIDEYVDFCDRNKILPADTTPLQYKERFEMTYPFTPDVIDVLYGHWGTIDRFQRTRGVLRLLSLVANSLKNTSRPYITLADFNLTIDTIRMALLDYTPDNRQFESVLQNDIVGNNALVGNNDIDRQSAIAIFMYSFNKDGGKGASEFDIKRAVAKPEKHDDNTVICADVGNALVSIERKLDYVVNNDGMYKFTSKTTANRIRKNIVVSDMEMRTEKYRSIKNILGSAFESIYLWPENTKTVKDNAETCLVILDDNDRTKITKFINTCGDYDRSFKNGVFILCPSNENGLDRVARQKIQHEKLLEEHSKTLDTRDIKKSRDEIKSLENNIPVHIRGAYNMLYVCGKSGQPEIISLEGEGADHLSERVSNVLKQEGKLLPVLGEKTLKKIHTGNMEDAQKVYDDILRKPGAPRPISVKVVENTLENKRHAKYEIEVKVPHKTDTKVTDMVCNVNAKLTVRKGREKDIAVFLENAIKNGLETTIEINLTGNMKSSDVGKWRDFAMDIDSGADIA